MKILYRSIFLMLLFPPIIYGQNEIRPEITIIKNEIANENVLNGQFVGFAGIESDQWKRYIKLLTISTEEELVFLTDDPNPVVRSYAFKALVKKNYPNLFSILLNHLSDNTTVHTFYGCEVSSSMVGDVFLKFMKPDRYDNDGNLISDEIKFKLSEKQKIEIENKLIFDKEVKLNAKSELLRNIKPNNEYYKRIREIVINEKFNSSLIALARFKSENDITIIKKWLTENYFLNDGLQAVIIFPDKEFYNILVNIFNTEWEKKLYDYARWRLLIQALAQYPNRGTIKLFEKILYTKDEFRYQTLSTYLLIAIKKFPNDFYEPILPKIKLDKSHMEEAEEWFNGSYSKIF